MVPPDPYRVDACRRVDEGHAQSSVGSFPLGRHLVADQFWEEADQDQTYEERDLQPARGGPMSEGLRYNSLSLNACVSSFPYS